MRSHLRWTSLCSIPKHKSHCFWHHLHMLLDDGWVLLLLLQLVIEWARSCSLVSTVVSRYAWTYANLMSTGNGWFCSLHLLLRHTPRQRRLLRSQNSTDALPCDAQTQIDILSGENTGRVRTEGHACFGPSLARSSDRHHHAIISAACGWCEMMGSTMV